MVPECKMAVNEPVFVLGLPRCRTAWLAMCLSSRGVDCSHEGLRDHTSFEDYAAELNERLALGMAGDADPGLCFFVDQLLETWPQARFVMITREDDNGFALEHAAPGLASHENWDGILSVFKGACDKLRERAETVSFHDVDELAKNSVMCGLIAALTGKRPSEIWAKRMQRLKITSIIDPSECLVKTQPVKGIQVPSMRPWDAQGLSAEIFQMQHFEMVYDWWMSHTGHDLKLSSLPPLGVIVRHNGTPWAAVWCYESYGVAVAELTFPVTKPGLKAKDSARALAYGALACMQAAGQGQQPPGCFRTFKVVCPKGKVKFMKSLGFNEFLTDRVPMLITL